MKQFAYTSAKTVDEATNILAKGSAAILAGGTDLMTVLKGMISPSTAPATLVNIKEISSLDYIKEDDGMLKIGAATKLATIAKSDLVKSKYTALADAALRVGTPELRNMGTIGGNICQYVRCWYFRSEHNAFDCLRKNPHGICYAIAGDNRVDSWPIQSWRNWLRS